MARRASHTVEGIFLSFFRTGKARFRGGAGGPACCRTWMLTPGSPLPAGLGPLQHAGSRLNDMRTRPMATGGADESLASSRPAKRQRAIKSVQKLTEALERENAHLAPLTSRTSSPRTSHLSHLAPLRPRGARCEVRACTL